MPSAGENAIVGDLQRICRPFQTLHEVAIAIEKHSCNFTVAIQLSCRDEESLQLALGERRYGSADVNDGSQVWHMRREFYINKQTNGPLRGRNPANEGCALGDAPGESTSLSTDFHQLCGETERDRQRCSSKQGHKINVGQRARFDLGFPTCNVQNGLIVEDLPRGVQKQKPVGGQRGPDQQEEMNVSGGNLLGSRDGGTLRRGNESEACLVLQLPGPHVDPGNRFVGVAEHDGCSGPGTKHVAQRRKRGSKSHGQKRWVATLNPAFH